MPIMMLPSHREIYGSKEEWDYATNLPGKDDLDPKLSNLAAEYKRLIDMGHTPSEAAAIVDSILGQPDLL